MRRLAVATVADRLSLPSSAHGRLFPAERGPGGDCCRDRDCEGHGYVPPGQLGDQPGGLEDPDHVVSGRMSLTRRYI